MVNAETAPALPWGISTAQGTAGRPAESQADRDQADREGALPVIVPQPGSAIEVSASESATCVHPSGYESAA